ncbi:MAG: DUF2069 domain-containing protein [Ostreibacterium sp.]
MSLFVYRRLALFAIVGLVVVFMLFGVTRVSEQKALTLLLTALPLAIPIRGTLMGQAYTIGYSALLSTGYFCLSGWLYIVHFDWVHWLMLVGILLSLLWFFACLLHNKKLKNQHRKYGKLK